MPETRGGKRLGDWLTMTAICPRARTMNALLSVVLLSVQQVEPPPDERPEIQAKLAELAEHVKERGKADDQAIAVIDALTPEFPNSGPKDRAAIVKALEACFKANRKELEGGLPDDQLYYAAATALGQMPPESVKPLTELLGHKSHRSNLRLQTRIALSLGATKDPRALEPLLALLEHKDKEMQVAGAESLASYEGADLATRKRIFEPLLRTLMDQKTKKDNDSSDLEALERWNAISGPIVTSLQRLSGQNETEAEAWQRWWNKNKKADWGEGKK